MKTGLGLGYGGPFGLIVKWLWVTTLVSKQEARPASAPKGAQYE